MADKLGIYKVISPSGRIYVGQSWNILRRFEQYSRVNACKSQNILYNSLVKYGSQAHTFKILHELPEDITQSVLDTYEQVYIDSYKEVGLNLMNIREAGSRGKHSEETKKKIALSKIGNKVNIGRITSDETKLKQRISKLGKSHPNMGIYNIKKISQLSIEGIWIEDFDSISEASNKLGIKRKSISECVNGRNKTAKGFIFREYGKR